MQINILQEKLKQIFPQYSHNPKNSHPTLNPNLFLNQITNFPLLPIQQLHLLCRNQQKNVMTKIIELKQRDLYEEMANICPNRDLQLMRFYSQDQVNQKIKYYQSQIHHHYLIDQHLLLHSDNSNQEQLSDGFSAGNRNLHTNNKIIQSNNLMDMEVGGYISHSKMLDNQYEYLLNCNVQQQQHKIPHEIRNILQEYQGIDQNHFQWYLFEHHFQCIH